MKQTEKKIRQWLEVRLVAPPAVASVRLYHAAETQDGTAEMLVFKRPIRDLDGRALELAGEVARELQAAAEDHAEAFAEEEIPQLYNVVIFSKSPEGKLRRGESRPMRLRDETRATSLRGPVGRPFGTTEPATTRGERAQSMRHIEALARIYVDGSTTNLGIMQRLVERLEDANLALSAGMTERIKATAELHDNKHQRDMEVARFVAEEDRKGEVAKKVIDTVIPEFARRAIPKMFGDDAKAAALEAPKPSDAPDERLELRRLVEGLPSSVSGIVLEAVPDAQRLELLGVLRGSGPLTAAERNKVARAIYGLPVGPSETLAQALGEERSKRLVRMIGEVPPDLIHATEGAASA